MEVNRGVVLAKNIIEANIRLSEEYGRPVINGFETSCFVFFAGCLARSFFTPGQIIDTLLIEDHLERYNFKMDELIVDNPTKMREENIEYEIERNLLCRRIHNRYRTKFGVKIGEERWGRVNKSIEDWFNIGRKFDEIVTVGDVVCQSSKVGDERVENSLRILENTPLPEKGLVQKEIIDGLWVNTICKILAEGDEKQYKEIYESMWAFTMLFQLEEDFVNIKRDRRVGKKSIFTTHDILNLIERTDYVMRKIPKYLNKITERPLVEAVIFTGWLGKCVLAGIKSLKKGEKWRAVSDYIRADDYERKRLNNLI